jgi:hypothetical protein
MRRRIAIALAIVAAVLATAGSAAAGFSDGTDCTPSTLLTAPSGFSDGVDALAQ